jgi:hypothetical protein
MSRVEISEGELMRDDESGIEAEFADFADSIRADQTAEGYIKIWKVPLDAEGNPRSNSMQQALLTTIPLGTMSIDDVCNLVKRRFFRPGELRMTICVRGYQKGRRGHRFQNFLTLERENEAIEPPSSNSTTGDVAAMLKLIQQSNEAAQARTENFMREMMGMQLRAAPSAPAISDPVAMMQQVGTMMTIFQGMFANMARPAIAPGADSDPIATMVKQIGHLKQLQNALGGKAEEDSGTLGIIKAIGPLAAPVLQMMAANAQNRPMRRKQLPKQPAPAVPAPVAEPVSTPSAADNVLPEESTVKLKDALNELCDMAESSADPVAAAALALDLLPDEYDAQVGALVSEPDSFLPKIRLLCPRTANFPAWFEALREEMARAYEDDPDAIESEDEAEEE